MSFRCPVCSCLEYQRVVVPRDVGAPYETEFFHCLGCSAMFLEPELFTAAPEHRKSAPAAWPIGAAERSMLSQRIRVRFWIAKARRLCGGDGGMDPSDEEILRVRRRYRQ